MKPSEEVWWQKRKPWTLALVERRLFHVHLGPGRLQHRLTLMLVLSFPKTFGNIFLFISSSTHNFFCHDCNRRGELGFGVGLGMQSALYDFYFVPHSSYYVGKYLWRILNFLKQAVRQQGWRNPSWKLNQALPLTGKNLPLASLVHQEHTVAASTSLMCQEPAPGITGSSGTHCCSIYHTDVSREGNRTVGLKHIQRMPMANSRESGSVVRGCVWMCAWVCVCAGAPGGQKRISDPLEVDLRAAISYLNWTQILCKDSKDS